MSEAYQNSGVPEIVFQDGFNGGVVLKSGTRLQCEVSQERVSLVDLDYTNNQGVPCYLFVAKAEHDSDAGLRTLELVVRTEHDEPKVKKHPDLRAAALLGRVIRYFDEYGPQPLTHMEAYWDARSPHLTTNYRHFRSEVARLAEAGPVSDAHRKAAVLTTWTGREIRKHGFYTIEHIEDTGEEVTVLFARTEK